VFLSYPPGNVTVPGVPTNYYSEVREVKKISIQQEKLLGYKTLPQSRAAKAGNILPATALPKIGNGKLPPAPAMPKIGRTKGG